MQRRGKHSKDCYFLIICVLVPQKDLISTLMGLKLKKQMPHSSTPTTPSSFPKVLINTQFSKENKIAEKKAEKIIKFAFKTKIMAKQLCSKQEYSQDKPLQGQLCVPALSAHCSSREYSPGPSAGVRFWTLNEDSIFFPFSFCKLTNLILLHATKAD